LEFGFVFLGFFPTPFSVQPVPSLFLCSGSQPVTVMRSGTHSRANSRSPLSTRASPGAPELLGRATLALFLSVVWFVHSSCGAGQCAFHRRGVWWSCCNSGSLHLSYCQPLQRKRRASSIGCFASSELPKPLLVWQTHRSVLLSQKECGLTCSLSLSLV